MARETTLERVIQARMHLPDGTMLKGVVKDLSWRGAGIVGEASGVSVGDVFTVAFVLPEGRQVTYECRVMHIDPGISFGVRFLQ